jgi:hypothetical protein
MTLTVVPETSTATTMLAVDFSKQIIQLHVAESSLINSGSLMWLRFPRHLRNPRKHYTSEQLAFAPCPVPGKSSPCHIQHLSDVFQYPTYALVSQVVSSLHVSDNFVFLIPCVLHSQPMSPQFHFTTYKLTTVQHDKVNFRSDIFRTHDIGSAYSRT